MIHRRPRPVVERDLRLDLFRGIGLWMVFLDHIPQDVVAWLTLRNYGFSDAAESTLNYDVRVLGSNGVLSLNAVAGIIK